MAHTVHSLYVGCDFDIRPQWALVFYLISHLLLFSNFYVHAYIRPESRPKHGPKVGGAMREGAKVEENMKSNGSSETTNIPNGMMPTETDKNK